MFTNNICSVPADAKDQEIYLSRCKRDLYEDLKTAIDCLKNLDDTLNTLHPDVRYKIQRFLTA